MRPVISYRVAGWLFPRGVAAVYFIAFLSWWVQCDGLTGVHGIAPVSEFLERVGRHADQAGVHRFWEWPSVYWWGTFSDASAHWLCVAGLAASVLVMLGVFQGPLLLALWFGYLSIVTTSNVFMNYQWDALLLETGFLAVLISPWRPFVCRFRPSSPAASQWQMLLPQLLLLKLMFLSGFVKLQAKDSSWWPDLTALRYHFESQPIPTWIGWWAHQLPGWVQAVNCLVMFAIELGLPVLIPAVVLADALGSPGKLTRWLRLLIFGGTAALMVVVELTGNYTYFNLLTALLAIPLLDDRCWPRWCKRWLRCGEEPPPKRSLWITGLQCGLTSVMVLLSGGIVFLEVIEPELLANSELPKWLDKSARHVLAFESVNTYGLFRVMTKERNEIVIEVSDDGLSWEPLEFKWKPGRLERAPPFVAPHQPRLDWQMWFAALYPGYDPQRDAGVSQIAWFGHFLSAILDGRKEVFELLEPSPIPPGKIIAVRALFYRYQFTDWNTRRTTGKWWTRGLVGYYTPVLKKRP